MDKDLKQNFVKIIQTLEGRGMKSTTIAHAIGFTTTRQLYNTVDGKSMLSSKAMIGLIKNLNINPIYLFLGKGDMFLPDETEIETLRRENREWIQRHNEVVKGVMSLNETIKTLEQRNADLIDLSSAAIKYYKGQNQEEQTLEENDKQDPNFEDNNILRWRGKEKKEKEKVSAASNLMESISINNQIRQRTKTLKWESIKEEPKISEKRDKK
jgi:hypothetical protein